MIRSDIEEALVSSKCKINLCIKLYELLRLRLIGGKIT